jgi:phospholipase/carboxylesterase
MSLQVLAFPPSTEQAPKGVLVLLHGWGANAEDVASLAPHLELDEYLLVFPNAPFQHPFSDGGRMWYGFPGGLVPQDFDFPTSPDFQAQKDLPHSRELLTALMHALPEKTKVPLERTFLGGFSQGGAMALDVGSQFPLAGLLVLSGYLHRPLAQLTGSQLTGANRSGTKPSGHLPVLQVHGQQDPVVPLAAAHLTREALKALTPELHYHEFEGMGHEIGWPVIEQMQRFIHQVADE